MSVRQKQREPQILTIVHDEDDNNNEDVLMDCEDDLGIHSVTPPATSPDSDYGRLPSPPGRLGSPKQPKQSSKGRVRPKTAGKCHGHIMLYQRYCCTVNNPVIYNLRKLRD